MSIRYLLKDSRRTKAACFQLLEAKSPQTVVANIYSDDLALELSDLLNGNQENKTPDVLALGYKNKHGHIVVTDVLCVGLPAMSLTQKAEFSWFVTQWKNGPQS